jgi:hypothetical protein
MLRKKVMQRKLGNSLEFTTSILAPLGMVCQSHSHKYRELSDIFASLTVDHIQRSLLSLDVCCAWSHKLADGYYRVTGNLKARKACSDIFQVLILNNY